MIRIFSRRYSSSDEVSVETIINDTVECQMHTSVKAGLDDGLWHHYSDALIMNPAPILFRISEDYGLYPGQQIVSQRWVIWEMNRDRNRTGVLQDAYHCADLGGVYAPKHVMARLIIGVDPVKYYPSY